MWKVIVEIPLFGKTISIQSYGTVIVLAFLLAAWWTRRAAKSRLALDPERVFNVGFALLFLGLLGARLAFAMAHYQRFTERPMSFLAIWEGGLIGYGGVIAGLLWLAWYLPRHAELKGPALLDLLVRGACLAFAVGWIACLLAGDDYGKATTAPWGIPVTAFQPGTPAAGYPDPLARLHPTQVYESVFALVLFLGLGLLARRRLPSGRVAAAGLMIHSVGHATLDLFRGDVERGMLVAGTVSWTQFLAVPVFFTGLALWLIRRPEPARRSAA